MSDQEQLAILKQGVWEWNEWRAKNPDGAIDLRNADLSDANLNETELSGAHLVADEQSDIPMDEIGFIIANLTAADLSGAHLSDTLQLHFFPQR